MAGWRAYKEGLLQSLRYWQVLLLFFLAVAGSALLVGLLPGLAALPSARRPPFAELTGGLEGWMLVDLFSSLGPSSGSVAADPGLQQMLLPWVIAVLFLPFVSALPSAFLLGGTLLTYFEAPQSFQWHRFWWGCWHWWGAFLLFGFIQGLVFIVLFLPLAITGLSVIATTSWLAPILLPALGLLFLIGVVIGELGRAYAVARNTRNIFQMLALSAGTFFRRPLALIGLYLPALLLLGMLHLVFRLGLLPFISTEIWVAFFVAAQVFILLRLWSRLMRLSGVVNLVRWM